MAKRRVSQLNCLIAVDKPVGCTSHDVVSRVRRALGERRVGHAGTLDPLASGVMVVGIGQATRLLGMLTLDTKAYVAEITFGSETSTDDAEGEVVREADVHPGLFEHAAAEAACRSVLRQQMQIPPSYSAISVNGVRSYKRARAGEDVELEARPIEVLAADPIAVANRDGVPVWTVAFTVSKGTYIRALARDMGRALGTAAHLSALRRTASGSIGLGSCVSLDDLDVRTVCEHMLDPVRALDVPAVVLPERLREDVLCGKRLSSSIAVGADGRPIGEGERCALVSGGSLVALAAVQGSALAPRDVFPQPIGGVAL